MTHDENNVLTDHELVIVRDFLRRKNMQMYTYGMNILVDLMHWIVHGVIIFLSEPKKTHLKLPSYPKKSKTSDFIKMAGVLRWEHVTGRFFIRYLTHSQCHPSLHFL